MAGRPAETKVQENQQEEEIGPMARSKNRLVDYDKGNGEILTARLELENGEVVEGHYQVYFWLQPPSDVYEEALRICSLPPVATYGKVK
mgnify:CR=1 FL=1